VPEHVRVAIIGAGFGGLGAAIQLRQAGMTDFVILERAASVGGTWRDNTYPGCACDVPSHLYSFSFAPNPGWPHSFSRQPEIWAYLEQITDRYGLRGHLRLGAELSDARWDPGQARWELRISRSGPAVRADLAADVLISAAGPLSEPRLPGIPGLAEFPGEVFHSARWDHGARLDGRRVAVVGTGASAIQIVPEIQPTVAWCSSSAPRPGYCRAVTGSSPGRRSGFTVTFHRPSGWPGWGTIWSGSPRSPPSSHGRGC
jgi:cation diffusion facilitator CzcD-associated flavoprotein CzcO